MNLDRAGEESPNAPGGPGQSGPPPALPEESGQPRAEAATDAAAERHGFALQPGGRTAAAAGSAQPQPRRGLELVDPGAAYDEAASGQVGEKHSEEDPHLQTAARMMQAIEDEVEQIRRGAGRVIPFQPAAGAQLPRLGARLGRALSRLSLNARRMAEEKPVQTFAAMCGLGFAIVAAIRLRNSSRK